MAPLKNPSPIALEPNLGAVGNNTEFMAVTASDPPPIPPAPSMRASQ